MMSPVWIWWCNMYDTEKGCCNVIQDDHKLVKGVVRKWLIKTYIILSSADDCLHNYSSLFTNEKMSYQREYKLTMIHSTMLYLNR